MSTLRIEITGDILTVTDPDNNQGLPRELLRKMRIPLGDLQVGGYAYRYVRDYQAAGGNGGAVFERVEETVNEESGVFEAVIKVRILLGDLQVGGKYRYVRDYQAAGGNGGAVFERVEETVNEESGVFEAVIKDGHVEVTRADSVIDVSSDLLRAMKVEPREDFTVGGFTYRHVQDLTFADSGIYCGARYRLVDGPE